jgi:hypothetical protein
MNHLKKFHLFENLSEEDKINNEKYFELVDILQSKVFDYFDVIAGTDENFNGQSPKHKFWLFATKSKLVSSKELGSKIIRSLNIFNISPEEDMNFFESLRVLQGLIYDCLDKNLIVKTDLIEDEDEDGSIQISYDYIIHLGLKTNI